MRKNFAKGVAVGAGLVLVGIMLGAQGDQPNVVGIAATNQYLYRLLDNGGVEYIPLTSERTGKGVPNWTELAVDTGRTSRQQPH